MKEKAEKTSIRELRHKEILSLDEVSRLYGLRPSLIYSLTHRKQIPYYKLPGSNLLFFNNAEVKQWMLDNRVAPKAEHQQ